MRPRPEVPRGVDLGGSRLVILEHGSLADVAGPVGVLLVFGLGAAAVFVACYRPADLKKSFV